MSICSTVLMNIGPVIFLVPPPCTWSRLVVMPLPVMTTAQPVMSLVPDEKREHVSVVVVPLRSRMPAVNGPMPPAGLAHSVCPSRTRSTP